METPNNHKVSQLFLIPPKGGKLSLFCVSAGTQRKRERLMEIKINGKKRIPFELSGSYVKCDYLTAAKTKHLLDAVIRCYGTGYNEGRKHGLF